MRCMEPPTIRMGYKTDRRVPVWERRGQRLMRLMGAKRRAAAMLMVFVALHSRALALTYSISSWNLDMTKGTLSLVFPVEMQAKTLNASALILQSSAAAAPAADASLRLRGHYPTGPDYNSTHVEIFLKNEDYYAIQLDSRLGKSPDTSYLRVDGDLLKAVIDQNGVTQIANGYALRAAAYVPDRLPPFLLSWTLDMNSGAMSLTFNEPVSLPSFDPTAITLQQAQDKIYDESWEQYRLADWNRYTLMADGVNVTGVTHLHYEYSYTVGINETYPYHYLGLLPGTPENFTVVWDRHNYTYRIDANATYWLSFSEERGDAFTVRLHIGAENLNKIKAQSPLAIDRESVFLAAYRPIVSDIAGNNMSVNTVTDYLALAVSDYRPDVTPPELSAFTLDFNAGILYLDFSETVNVRMINVTRLCLQKQRDMTLDHAAWAAGEFYCLTPGVSGSGQAATAAVAVTMGEEDLNAVKMRQRYGLCTSTASAYLSFPSTLAADMAWLENPVLPISSHSALMASDIVTDKSSPTLKFFDLDWERRLLTLVLSEAVSAQSVVVEDMTLQGSSNTGRSGARYSLTSSSSSVISGGGPAVVISIGLSDYSAIKLKTGLCNTPTTTYISFPRTALTDLNQVVPMNVMPVAASKAVAVRRYVPDTSPPFLLGFVLDLNGNTLTLSFSEPVRVSMLNTTGVVLHSSSDKAQSYRLVDSAVAFNAANAMDAFVYLGGNDIQSIKAYTSLCRSRVDCYASIDAGTVMDLNEPNIANECLESPEAVQVTEYIADTTEPQLMSFDLDVSDGTMTLTFDEPVMADWLNCSAISLRASPASDAEEVRLSENCANGNGNINRLVIRLWQRDMSQIRMQASLGRSADTTYMVADDGLVSDMYGNFMSAIGNLSSNGSFYMGARRVSTFGPDLTGPSLLSWDLRKDERRIRLYFDEPVNVSAATVAAITIQGFSTRLNFPWYTLTRASSSAAISNVTDDCSVVDVTIGPTDMAQINARRTRMGSMHTNSFLLLSRYAVTDTSGNRNTPIYDGQALQLGPTLSSWSLDMDQGIMTLLLSRPLDLNSVEVNVITLLNAGYAEASTVYMLTNLGDNEAIELLYDDTAIAITLTDDDLAAIKTLGDLCISAATCYVSLDSLTVTDSDSYTSNCCGRNPVVEVTLTAPMQTALYRADVTAPRLLQWDLDLNTGLLTLEFDEAVTAENLDLSGITFFLPGDENATAPAVTLSSGSTVLSDSGSVQVIRLQQGDGVGMELDAVKLLLSHPDSAALIALAMQKGTAMDMALVGNPSEAVNTTDPLRVNVLRPDNTPPKLLYFDVNMTASQLTLVFSEAVNRSSFRVQDLWLHPAANTPAAQRSNLTAGCSTVANVTEDGASVTVDLCKEDMRRLKTAYPLLSSVAFVYLTARGGLCADVSAAQNEFVSAGPFKINTFVQDYIRPKVVGFDFSMDNGELAIYLDEPVRPEMTDVTGLTIQRGNFSGDAYEWALTLSDRSSYVMTAGGIGTTVVIRVGQLDREHMQMKDGVALSRETTYLRVDERAFTDIAGNLVVEIPDGDAIQVSNFSPDVTPPEIQAFSLYHDARLVVYLSEPIQVASFDVTGLQLQNRWLNASWNLTQLTKIETTENNLVIQLDLSGDWSHNARGGWGTPNSDIYWLQIRGIGLEQAQTYLAAAAYTCMDVAGNRLLPLSLDRRLMMGPTVMSYILDMGNSQLNLTFNLPVFGGSAVNPAAIAIQSSENGRTYYSRLSACSSSSSANGTLISIDICKGDLDAIKGQRSLALDTSSTFLTVDKDEASGMILTRSISTRPVGFYVAVVPIPPTRAIQALVLTPDTTRPTLDSFVMNLNEGTLDLYFSEPVVIETLMSSGLTVYGSATLEPYCILSTPAASANSVGDYTSSHLRFTLEADDRICVAVYGVGKLLTMLATTGTDYAGNQLVEISPVTPIMASTLIPDTTPPRIVNATLNLTTGNLHLTFSEVVNPETLDSSGLSLVYHDASGAQTLNLTTEATTFSVASTTMVLELWFVFSLLTSLQGLALDAYGTTALLTGFDPSLLYVHATAGVVNDFADIAILSQAMPITAVIPDYLGPVLLSFHLDLSSWQLQLYFNEGVRPNTLNPSKIMIQASATSGSPVTLSGASTPTLSATASRLITLTIDGTDKSNLQTCGFATTQADTFVSLASGAVLDWSPNLNPSVAMSSGIQQGPRLLRATLDLNKQIMLLVFSHPITFSTLMPMELLLVGNASSNSLRLYNSTVTNLQAPSVTTVYARVDLGSEIMDALKMRDGLAKSVNHTSVAAGSDLATDSYGNKVVEISTADSLRLHSFKRDTGHPMITRVALDMNTATLNVSFSEPVDLRLAAVQYITLQSQRVYYINSTVHVLFDSGKCRVRNVAERYSRTVVIGIGEREMAELKMSTNIARTRSNTYFTSVRDCFFDTATPPNTAWSILRSNSYMVDDIRPDITQPRLQYFAYDVDAAVLSLVFDEPMDLMSLNISGLQLMEFAFSGYGGHYRLTNHSELWSEDYGRQVKIRLSPQGWTAINADVKLARTVDQTFLTIDNDTISDTSGNFVVPIIDGEGRLAAFYTPDQTPPRLLNYTINMDSGLLALYFSEMVSADSFDASGFTFESLNKSCFYYNTQGRRASSCSSEEWANVKSVTLDKEHTVYDGPNAQVLFVNLSEYDLNSLKITPLVCESKNSTHLVIMAKAVTDLNGNGVVQIGGLPVAYDPAIVSRGMEAGAHFPDTTPAHLRWFNLDMNRGLLTMEFSECVVLSPNNLVDVQGILLHSNPIAVDGRTHRLTGYQSLTSQQPIGFSNRVKLVLANEDLDRLKVLRIGRQDVVRQNGRNLDDSVYMTLRRGAFVEPGGLPVMPVLDADVANVTALKVQNLTLDTLSPRLSRFVIDRTTMWLHISFTEAINKTSIQVSGFQLLIFLGPVTLKTRLRFSTMVPEPSQATIILDLASTQGLLDSTADKTDWENLLEMVGEATSNPLYIAVDAGAVLDLAKDANELRAISVYAPLRESRAVCTCPDDRFAEAPCTTVRDVKCQQCTQCQSPHSYTLRPCSDEADTQCGTCRACRFPFFASMPCRGGNDTVCVPCRECGPEEYVTKECTSTSDRVCASCRMCQYMTEEQERGCLHTSIAWRDENCCKDSRGQPVDCSERSLAEFAISAMAGRRHWVFKKTIPKVQGQTQWTGNFFDWYQATKSETGYA